MLPIAPRSYHLTPAAAGRASRLVFASPHSGEDLPEDMCPAQGLGSDRLNSACDVAVDQLIARAPAGGVPLISGCISRAYVDLNRSPADIDPALLDVVPEGLSAGPKARAGYGVVPRLSGDGQPLYDRRLSLSEVQARLQGVHAPYHATLAELMQATRSRHGRAILIDWHSMPKRATGATGADVVLGDRYGSACQTEVTRLLRGLFEGLGWKVSLNHPYAGGYSTQVWGRPEEGFEAIQIEISRRLYWDEVAGQPSAGWRRCQSGLNRVIAGLIAAHEVENG